MCYLSKKKVREDTGNGDVQCLCVGVGVGVDVGVGVQPGVVWGRHYASPLETIITENTCSASQKLMVKFNTGVNSELGKG